MLYVFVHGLAVVGVRPADGKLEIVLPQVNGHVYKAGSWLAEMPIQTGASLELKTVEPGNADIYNTGFLVDIPKPYLVTQNGRAATIIAPKPDRILGLTRASDQAWVARLNTPTPKVFNDLADVLVFAYNYRDENEILLDGFGGQPGHDWQPCVTRGAMSLHIIATSETPEDAQHRADTESALKVVYGHQFPGLTYPVPGALRTPWMDPAPRELQGLHERGGYVYESNGDFAFALAESEHPSSRAQRLERLGRMHRGDRRIESLWRRPDPLSDSMGGPCGSETAYLS